MSRRIGLIVNPLSHTVRRKGSILEQAAGRIEDASLVRIDDFARLSGQLRELAAENPAALFIEGGDGTLQAVLSAWPGFAQGGGPLPDIAVLPGGSTNLAFKVAGLKRRSAEDIATFVQSYRADGVITRTSLPALRIESDSLPAPLAGMLLSTGSLARAMVYTQKQIHGDGHRGSLAVAEAAARFVLSPEAYLDTDGAPLLRPGDFMAESPAFRLQGAHALSLMTTMPYLSLGLKPFWGEASGPIAVTYAQWPISGFRAAFLKILANATGPEMTRHGLTSYRTGSLTFSCSGPVVLDGEVLQIPADARIRVSSTRPIRFLR
jgi:hypothetical protein